MYLFVATHLGSGSDTVCKSLSLHPNIIRAEPRFSYTHPTDLVKSLRFKIVYDELFFNHQIGSPCLYHICKYIYIIKDSSCLAEIPYERECAFRYYTYRLRRLCEMAKHTSGLLITWGDIVSGEAFPMIQDFLGLRRPLRVIRPDLRSSAMVEKAQIRYEKYFSYLHKNLVVLPPGLI